ncbi:MAG: aldehyde dehydrogenase family protein [Bacillota bacterium]
MSLSQLTVVPVRIGKENQPGRAGTYTLHAPYGGRPLAEVALADAAQAHLAVAAALEAFHSYRNSPAHERATLLLEASRRLEQEREAFARLLAEEVGKPIRAARAEVDRTIMTLRLSGEEARRLNGEVIPVDATAAGAGKRGLTIPQPLGVVTCITPFNYPLNLLAHKLGPALAAGNTVVVKPSPKAPLSTARLAELIESAGFPAGAINLVPCEPDVAELLVSHPDVAAVSFTGSAAVGRIIRNQAGLKPVVLELGSNAGNVVAPSADLDLAARSCASGGYVYAGQSCISVQRVYVHRSVMDQFAAKLVAHVRNLRLGDPLDESTDVGPLIDLASAERVAAWVEEAVAGGARLLCGGRREGSLFEPTVLQNTRPEMRVVCEEVFGPVVSLMAYEEFDEALAAVNASRYGLHAGIFTNDLQEAARAVRELTVGGVVVNDASTFRSDLMPYAGVRESGLGREGIRYAIADLTHLKAVYLPL